MHFQLGVFSISCFYEINLFCEILQKMLKKKILIKNSNKNLQNVRVFFFNFLFNHMKAHFSCTASLKITYDI